MDGQPREIQTGSAEQPITLDQLKMEIVQHMALGESHLFHVRATSEEIHGLLNELRDTMDFSLAFIYPDEGGTVRVTKYTL
jgi:hypothetical protein